MKRAGLGDPSAPGFEKWAENFNKNSFTEESQHRTKRIMNWIEQQTGRFSNLSVLDVGLRQECLVSRLLKVVLKLQRWNHRQFYMTC